MGPGRAIAGVLTLALVLGGGLGAATAAAQSLEYPVKAAYLYKFGPFVEWPPTAFADADSPVVLCVVGEDPFGAMLDKAVDGQHIAGRAIVVRRLERLERGSACHIAYLSGSRSQSVAEAVAAARGSNMLTVTDASRSGGVRGIVHFVIKDNRVRFHIDDQAAAQNGVNISSKLLSLALTVKIRRERG